MTEPHNVAREELLQIIEGVEHLEAEKRDLSEQIKERFADAKGRGYDTKIIRKIIAIWKRKADDLAEEQALLDLYLGALGQ